MTRKPDLNGLPALAQLDQLVCPRCESQLLAGVEALEFHCQSCHQRYPIRDGIPILLPDANARSKLEDIDYDRIHKIDPIACSRLYERWSSVLDHYQVKGGEVLEIGCGTGFLTYGLMQSNEFKRVSASDISFRFLEALRIRTHELASAPDLYVADANHLPFRSDSYDAVLGNSVLHHFLDFEATLRSCARILRPGGVAVFFEPVVQGKTLIAFLTDLMLQIDQRFQLHVFDEGERGRLERLVNHQVMVPKLRHDRERLARMEDKYIFDTSELNEVARVSGFAAFESHNQENPALRGYKPYVLRNLALHGISADQVGQFDFLFESFGKTISDTLGADISTPMQYLVFKK